MFTEAKLIVAAVAFIGLIVTTAFVTHKFDSARYANLQRDYALAQSRAIEAVLARENKADVGNVVATAANAEVQDRIVTQTINTIQEVHHHDFKTITISCVPLGFVRVLDAEIHGVAPDQLPLPAGSTDDTCSPLDWPDVASAIVANFGRARQNAEQLDALSASARRLAAP